MGLARFLTDQGIYVRPHLHIWPASVTYLYKGEFQRRDSLGANQIIYSEEMNLVIAGNGVTYPERTSGKTGRKGSSLFVIQTWLGLLKEHEEADTGFDQHNEMARVFLASEGKQVLLILGST